MSGTAENTAITLDECYAYLQRIGTHFSFTSHGEPMVKGPVPDALRGPNHKPVDVLNELSSQLGISKTGLGLAVNRTSNEFTLTFYNSVPEFQTIVSTVKLLETIQHEKQSDMAAEPARIHPEHMGRVDVSSQEKGRK